MIDETVTQDEVKAQDDLAKEVENAEVEAALAEAEAAAEPEPEPEPEAPEADDAPPEPELYDLVGADKRKIHRRVALSFAELERDRISAVTGEKLKVKKST